MPRNTDPDANLAQAEMDGMARLLKSQREDVVHAVATEPEDILEGHDPASRLRVSIVRGEEVLYQGDDLPWGELQIIVAELY